MTLAKTDSAIVIPHRINWARSPTEKRVWRTQVVTGVTGAEERAQSPTEPTREAQAQILSLERRDRVQLTARILAALRTGKACIPRWWRAQYLEEDATATTAKVEGRHPWSHDEYAFFGRRDQMRDVQTERKINCGGTATSDWLDDDQFHQVGGSDESTTDTVELETIAGFPKPPQAVYQSARTLGISDPNNSITYRVSGLEPGIPCRVRLHFAEFDANFDGTNGRRVMDVTVSGADEWTKTRFEPYRAAGGDDRATTLDAIVEPGSDGKVTVKVEPHPPVEVTRVLSGATNLNGTQGLNEGELFVATGQPDPTKNGVYKVQGGTSVRAPGYTTGESMIGLVHKDTTDLQLWRNSNTFVPEVGKNAIEYTQDSTPYHMGINGIELYQYSWETVQLFGPARGILRWQGFLKGVYRKDDPVMPLLFGKADVQSDSAATDHESKTSIRVVGPAGEGGLGKSGQCPAEQCDDELPLFLGPSTEPSLSCSGTTRFYTAQLAWLIGDSTINPNEVLPPSWINCYKQLFEGDIDDNATDWGLRTAETKYFWTFEANSSAQKDFPDAQDPVANDECDWDTLDASHLQDDLLGNPVWRLRVKYCTP